MIRFFFISIFLLSNSVAWANWSVNVGSNNPYTSNLGVNFQKIWDPWALEAGIGTISSFDDDDDESGIKLGGGVNGKYLFYSGLFRPYLMMGFGMSSGVSGDGAGFGASGLVYGGGFFINDSSFYIHTAYASTGTGGTFLQFGVGFHL